MGQVVTFPDEVATAAPESEAARAHALYVLALYGDLEPRCFARLLEIEARRYREPEASRWALWTFQRYQEDRR